MKARNITLLHYDAILFDVDGTLIDSAPGIIHTLQEVFCTMGVDVSGVNLRRYLGPPLRKSFGEHFTDPALIEKATDLYRTSYAVKGSHECAVFPGVPQMLQRLKQAGFLLCTATSKPTKVVTPIFQRHFEEYLPQRTVEVSLKNAGLREGAFELEIKATDASLAGFGQGNTRTEVLAMRLDTQPPRISVKTLPPSVRRGGAAAIRYTIDEEVTQSGVLVAGYFVPGFLQKDGSYICFFPFPYTMTAVEYKNAVELTATDMAGNVTRSRLGLLAYERNFKSRVRETADI